MVRTTLLLVVVTLLCVGCNEEELKKKHYEEIAALETSHAKAIAALDAGWEGKYKTGINATIANFRPAGPDMRESQRRLAVPMEFGAALLFAILLVKTIGALIHEMKQMDQRRGVQIGWMMVFVGVVTTVAAAIIVPDWAGYPYRPVLWFTTIARPVGWLGNLFTILIAALLSCGIAYGLMRLGRSEIPRERKWGCSLIILALAFVGSHYKLACWSMISNIGSSTGYLIYPISVGEIIGGFLGIAAYWISNPEPEPEPCPVAALPLEDKEQAQLATLVRESTPARLTEENDEIILKYLPRVVELAVRVLSARH